MAQQQSLFDPEPDPWDLDDAAEHRVATVALSDGPGGLFDYEIPESLSGEVEPGRRVHVPFGKGNRAIVGYCVHVGVKKVKRALKEIRGVVDSQRLLSTEMLSLTEWMADRYLCKWAQVLEAVIPAGVRAKAGTREVTLLSVPTNVAARLTQLKLPAKQAAALKLLAASPKPLTAAQLAEAAGCTTGPIHQLVKKNLVLAETRRMQVMQHDELPAEKQENLQLNDDQQAALDTVLKPLHEQRHETILMHGVTGSGKTEVYIQAIEEVIRYGRQAIVLVPEISLTPQTRQRFRSRFENVAVLHSHLSGSERHWHWQRIARGEIQVVVGARSAVFAPVPHLGLIILDEEHDNSFKQDSAPRYHARDVARYRAQLENIPLVLGSATPSLESWQLAREEHSTLVSMPRRVMDLPLPEVKTLDMRLEYHDPRSRGAISHQLKMAMAQALKEKGQIILLLNRRGFSTHIQCPSCGEVVKCPDCDIALTHHRDGEKAICHYCEYEITAPPNCPDCQFDGIRYGGLGTQRLEAEVRARFPNEKCLRMDSDTMRKPGSHEEALGRFRAGEVQILLGTQMIAKGLDFPNVTLVGVINADTALHLPNFRAAENTFQLVTQVAGRTGRGKKGGRVLVQTFTPEHPAIQAAVRHDYLMFAKTELEEREDFGYPPFTSMVRLVVRSETESTAEAFADGLGERFAKKIEQDELTIRLMGPTAAPVAKLRGKYRFHMLLQGANGEVLRHLVRHVTSEVKTPASVQWIIDIDPYDML